jgi:clan AA aspartic protease
VTKSTEELHFLRIFVESLCKNISKMRLAYADIELLNPDDERAVRKGVLDQDDVRRVSMRILVDSGALMLCINEELKELLGFDEIIDYRLSRLADGSRLELPVVGPVEVRFEGRMSRVNALVLPGDNEPLLGAMPMEELDVFIHPATNRLIGQHLEGQVMMLK